MNKKKLYKVTSPQGEVYLVDRMFKFCKEHDLNVSCMFNVAVNKHNRKHHKGWHVEVLDSSIFEYPMIPDEACTTISKEVITEDGTEPDLYIDSLIENKNYKSQFKSSVKNVLEKDELFPKFTIDSDNTVGEIIFHMNKTMHIVGTIELLKNGKFKFTNNYFGSIYEKYKPSIFRLLGSFVKRIFRKK